MTFENICLEAAELLDFEHLLLCPLLLQLPRMLDRVNFVIKQAETTLLLTPPLFD